MRVDRLLRRAQAVLGAASLVLSGAAVAEGDGGKPLEVGAPPAAMIEALVTAIRQPALFVFPFTQAFEQPDRELVLMWAGNSLTTTTDITQVAWVAARGPAGSREYELSVEFRNDALIVRSSRVINPVMRGGVRVPFAPAKVSRTTLPLEGRVELAVIQPSMPVEGFQSRGLILCLTQVEAPPGEPAGGGRSDTPFEIRGIRGIASGRASGRLLSGMNVGRARAGIEVSAGLAPLEIAQDESTTRDPEVEILYLPRPPAAFSPLDPGAPELLRGVRIRGTVTLLTPSAFAQTRRTEETVWVWPLAPSEQPVGGAPGSAGESGAGAYGTCFAVVKHRHEESFFTRPEGELPVSGTSAPSGAAG